jgi:hypothetical protein
VRYAPRDVRLEQIDRTEKFLEQLDRSRDYRYQDLCRRITDFKPEMYPDLMVSGQDAAHDLRLFMKTSRTARLRLTLLEQVLTVEMSAGSSRFQRRPSIGGAAAGWSAAGSCSAIASGSVFKSSVERFVARQLTWTHVHTTFGRGREEIVS